MAEVEMNAALSGNPTPLQSARFWSKVKVGRPGECWPWRSSETEGVYSKFSPDGTATGGVAGHRLAYIFWTQKPIPDGLVVRHKCDWPPCCNPAHLELGTLADNNRDTRERGRWSPPPRLRGSKHPASKLTEDAVREILRRLIEGEAQLAIAQDHGVNQSVISGISRGKTWLHVDREGAR